MSRARTAREVAFDVLLAVAEADAYANLLLPTRIRRAELRAGEAALATELCYGTLRGQGFYDWIIEQAAHRSTTKIDTIALIALRLGVHQLIGTRVAAHAAVNETVSLVRRRAGRGPAGFVNAILRAVAQYDEAGWQQRLQAEEPDARTRLSVRYSHPRWIVDALADALDREGAGDELEDLLRSDNTAPLVQLAALPGRADRDALIDASLTAHPAAPTALELRQGDPASLPAVGDARARVQDAGSQLVALALTRARPLRPGERLLDLCAGPGGKSALLAAEALTAGAEFTANEITPTRAGLVRQALEPLGEFDVTELDGRDFADRRGEFDRVLVDAPCSGLGALRRRPEARWRKRADDITELRELQAELLDAALCATKPEGLVAYVTCSPHPAETTDIVTVAAGRGARILDTHRVATELAPRLRLAAIPVADGTAVQLWPHRHGTDAMFLTLLRPPTAEETA